MRSTRKSDLRSKKERERTRPEDAGTNHRRGRPPCLPRILKGLIAAPHPNSIFSGKEKRTMTDDLSKNLSEPGEERETSNESPYEAYGWEFHRKPLFYAALLTVLLYAFIFFFIRI